jgi:hypothetical protein
VDAVRDAVVLSEYAEMHTGMFSKRHLSKIETAKDLLRQVAEELD